jgi:hypothetical protein
MNQNQFNELALGLDLQDKTFLWVVRPSNDNKVNYVYSNERKILNYPSIACFISHCGWNSTKEGVHAEYYNRKYHEFLASSMTLRID